MSNAQYPQSTMRVFGCGGFGINIAKYFETASGKQFPGTASPAPVYIDTSRSNLKGLEDNPNVYLIPEKDGSGKIRGLNAREIAPIIKPILNQFKPGDFNVVVFSGSGGSGSVIGPLLTGELLKRGLPVVALVVGSSESAKATENTIKTIQSLEHQATASEAALVMAYEHNEAGRKRSEVDQVFKHLVSSLGVLASKQNDEMDSTDILHVFRFDKATNVDPRLATFSVHRSNDTLPADAQYISMASLYADPDAQAVSLTPDYHAAGYLPKGAVEGSQVFHFPVRLDEVRGIISYLEKFNKEYSGDVDTRVLAKRVVSANDVDPDTGLVL